MKPRTEISMQLYEMMLERGYPENLCELVTRNLNTDYTATRMIAYLSHYSYLPDIEVVDEMLAILSDRNAIIQKKEAEAALNAFMKSVEEALVSGDKVQLVGFGTFETRERAAREGRNPRTKEPLTIPASTVPVFKAGKELKEKVNK